MVNNPTTSVSGLTVGAGGINPASGTVINVNVTGLTLTGGTLFYGAGVPAGGLGANGDTYIRSDSGAGTAIYQKRAAAWVATAA